MKDGERPPNMRLKGTPVELDVTDRNGDPLTSLVLDMELSERERAVLNNLKAGKSQRDIARFLGLHSATPVNRIARRLRALGMLEGV
jgi:DNA-binding NarL/FixJ family response regulator